MNSAMFCSSPSKVWGAFLDPGAGIAARPVIGGTTDIFVEDMMLCGVIVEKGDGLEDESCGEG
jgi:hypothetical protein